jgi:hypothetical protein
MPDPADLRFFTALQQVLAGTDSADCAPCRAAVDTALATGDPLDLRAARHSLDALDPAARDRILAEVHARMASDLSAIWGALPHAGATRRSH